MKTLTLAFALTVAAVATAGQRAHSSNPMTIDGKKLAVTPSVYPFPQCPPACGAR
ncbi:MAG: hypothetical protein JOZ32_17390 [Bryobacterales bacterium]|nr:hypothetical protein [Bryobacterales bacterium]